MTWSTGSTSLGAWVCVHWSGASSGADRSTSTEWVEFTVRACE